VRADTTPPRVVLEGPAPRSTVAGTVPVRVQGWDDDSGIESLDLLVSDGGAEWRPLARFDAAAADADWDAATVEDGVYWLCAVAHDRAGNSAATEPLPLRVRNPPDPRL
jgi:hypothetical protein